MTKQRISLSRFEGNLQGIAGGVTLYRRGVDDFYLSHGYPRIYEELEAVRSKLEALNIYDRCREALKQAEAWIRSGPEYDKQAQLLLLDVGGELAHASGSFDRLQRRFRAANDASQGD